MSLSTDDTIAALATPAGTSALAVVRVSGPACRELATALRGQAPSPRRVGRGDYRDRTGAVIDDVVYTFLAGPGSYTGEDTLEISCHGNPFIVQKILEDLLARGCRSAQPGEFTQRAFLNGRLDLSQAEAVMDLIHARSDRSLFVANQQLKGSLGRRMQALIESLLAVLAHIEAYIDFPDEDLPSEDRGAVEQQVEAVARETARLLATSHYGELLREGIKTVLVGEPNAGKSSLLNQLVGRERALVSPEPGTTRDFIEERILLGAHSLRLIDTAGLNPSPTPLEQRGMEKTLERAEEADLFLWVADATRPLPPLPPRAQACLQPANTILVLNKSDLPGARLWDETPAGRRHPQQVALSALNGTGLEDLEAAIARLAEAFGQQQGEEIIAINARHADALQRARRDLESALASLRTQGPVELLASDLRGALDALGEIAGKVDNERMLDHLFATFCIGK